MRRIAILAACALSTACMCGAPGTTVSAYAGQLGKGSPPANVHDSMPDVVTIRLDESDAGGTLDGASITLARRGLAEFGDRLHVHERARAGSVLTSEYGYYRSDSLVFRSHSYRESGGDRWDDFKDAVARGRAYFEVHSSAVNDTAGLRLISRHRIAGACT